MMRTMSYGLDPAPRRVSVIRHNGDAAPTHSVVRFDDLNLDYPIDVKVLYRRIQAAAVLLCRPDVRVGTTPATDRAACPAAGTTVDSERIIAATVAAIRHAALLEHHRLMNEPPP